MVYAGDPIADERSARRTVPRPTGRSGRAWLAALVLAWGIQAIVTQSLLLREAVVLMLGSESAWGVVLFAWLLGVAVGATLGGWVAERIERADAGLVLALLGLSVASCVELWVFRGARAWLGVGPGELLPLPKTALAAVLFVSPISALVGMAFPLACCVTETARSGTRPLQTVRDDARASADNLEADGRPRQYPRTQRIFELGNVYAIESLGSLVGGAVFTFYAVEHLKPIQIALVCGAVTIGASAGLLRATCRSRRPAVLLASVAVAALGGGAFLGGALNHALVQRWWRNIAPGYELCADVESKYQKITLGRRSGQFTLYSDGYLAGDFPDPYTFAPLAHFWLCQHPSPRNVLVLGGGAEGLLSEILRHPVELVDYIEPDPRLTQVIEPFLADCDREALRSNRVRVQHVDARYFVKTQRDRFDLVIARLPEPISALRARFYTDEFFTELRRAMTARSLLCLTASAGPGELSGESAEYLASLRAALRRHFPAVVVGWGDPAQVLAASSGGLLTDDPAELAGRFVGRGVQSDYFGPQWFEGATDWLDPEKVARRSGDLDAAPCVLVSSDLHPVVYIQRLALWEKMTAGQQQKVMEWLRSVRWYELAGVLLAIGGVIVVSCFLAGRSGAPLPSGERGSACRGLADGAVVLSVGTTGFATMALSIIWLFSFQNLYGYVYQRIGWIIALFMGGLVVGCELVNRRSRRRSNLRDAQSFSWRWLIAVDVLLALLAGLVPVLLIWLGRMQSTPLAFTLVEWCVSIMVTVTGVLGGAAFPLAAGLQTGKAARSGTAAGIVVGADHAGACLGALLCGILLVPVFGTVAAACLLASMKVVSAGLLVFARER